MRWKVKVEDRRELERGERSIHVDARLPYNVQCTDAIHPNSPINKLIGDYNTRD